ncbi:hypothetical protein C4578_01185 [Candidatus Microgenomates bacterium]|jgi:vancomycin resistance protein YoaR|nr:MAG: hypothetical protein C4578_01185 [Candidatus Microgenomates bacterium]
MIRKSNKENKNSRVFPKTLSKEVYLPLLLSILSMFFALGLILAVSFVLKEIFYRQRIQPGVRVCGLSLSGTKKDKAILLLSQNVSKKPQNLVLEYEEKKYSLDLSTLNYNPENTVFKAIGLAKNKTPFSYFSYLKDFLLIAKNGKELQLDFSLNNQALEESIASVSAQLFIPAVSPEIKVNESKGIKTISVEAGKSGREVDQRKLKKNVLESLSCPKKEVLVQIPVNIISPEATKEELLLTQKRAELLLGREIILKLDSEIFKVNDEEIISFLNFNGSFDRSKIAEFAENLSQTIDSEPENAAFNFEENRVTLFKPSKEGLKLNKESFSNTFYETLLALEKSRQNQEIKIPVERTSPKISTGDINNLGIKELLAKGESLFHGSIPGRIHNVNLASLKLNGVLIPPGETFSFNKTVGDISAATGYKQAYIIKNGRTVLGDGGGVCQVSTTLFRAALNAGLLIKERHAHAYRVHYYEEDLGPGFDATVFDPTADLKFENNTSSHILIQTKIDIPKRKLAFELYGTKDNRKVEISKTRIWDKTPPPPDLYQDDPTLPTGTVKQVDWKAWGAKTSFDYKVTIDGEVLQEKTFYSNYRPWQAIFLRGTGP